MKKAFVFFAAVFALMVSCQKEVDVTPDKQQGNDKASSYTIPDGIPRTLKVSVDDLLTKTTYDENGVFSWTIGDQIAVVYTATIDNKLYQGWLAYEATTLENSDHYAVFTLVDDAKNKEKATYYSDNDYAPNGMAVYPSSIARPKLTFEEYKFEKSSYKDSGNQFVPFVTLGSIASTGITNLLLTGKKQEDESYKFNSAGSVLKLTISNVPQETTQIKLTTNDKSSSPVSGDFHLKESEGQIVYSIGTGGSYQSSWKDNFSPSLVADVSPASDNATVTVYYNVPVGIYAANKLSIELFNSEGKRFESRSIGAQLTTVRNQLLTIPTLTLETWTDLGTGTFVDKFLTSNWKFAKVNVQQSNENSKHFRIEDPYGVFASANNYPRQGNPDKYLYLTISENNVTFQQYETGLIKDSRVSVISFTKWTSDGTTAGYSKNKVIKSIDAGPAIIQLAPFYCYKDMSNGYSKNGEDNMIRIVFPAYYGSGQIASSSSPADALSYHIVVSGPNVATAKAALAGTDDAARSGVSSASSFTAADGVDLTVANTETGLNNYLGVKSYDADGNELFFTTYTLYHLSTSDSDAYAKQYVSKCKRGATDLNTTITLAASNDVFSGNMMITEFDGMCCDVSESAQWDPTSTNSHYFASRNKADFKDGSPIYGVYTPGNHDAANLVFTNSKNKDKPFFYDNNNVPHVLFSSDPDLKMCLDYVKPYRDEYNHLICWNACMYDYYYDGTYHQEGSAFDYFRGGLIGVGTKLNLSSIATITPASYEGTNVGDNLVDGNVDTIWHSQYNSTGKFSSTYGIYIDIDLGESVTVTNFAMRFCLRHSHNDHPDHIKIYASANGESWGSALAEMTDIYDTVGEYNWTSIVNCTAAEASRFVRIAILSSDGSNGVSYDFTTASGTECTHMAELEMYSLD